MLLGSWLEVGTLERKHTQEQATEARRCHGHGRPQYYNLSLSPYFQSCYHLTLAQGNKVLLHTHFKGLLDPPLLPSFSYIKVLTDHLTPTSTLQEPTTWASPSILKLSMWVLSISISITIFYRNHQHPSH